MCFERDNDVGGRLAYDNYIIGRDHQVIEMAVIAFLVDAVAGLVAAGTDGVFVGGEGCVQKALWRIAERKDKKQEPGDETSYGLVGAQKK